MALYFNPFKLNRKIMNTIPSITNIQSLLAKAVTHPYQAEMMVKNPEKFIENIGAAHEAKHMIFDFIKNYGDKFINASLLLKKKRYDGVIAALPLLAKIYNQEKLLTYWEAYLKSHTIDHQAEKNPINESIEFCNYLLNNQSSGKAEQQLLHYEIKRNQTLLAYGEHEYAYSHLQQVFNETSRESWQQVKIFFHPCAQIEIFPCNISILLKMLQSNADLQALEAAYVAKTETLFLYKNWHKGLITVIYLNQIFRTAIDELKQGTNLAEFLHKKLKENVEENEIITFIRSLINSGIAILIPVNIKENPHAI